MWNDPTIRIDWKTIAPDVKPLLSKKDGKHPAYDAVKNYFDIRKKLYSLEKIAEQYNSLY